MSSLDMSYVPYKDRGQEIELIGVSDDTLGQLLASRYQEPLPRAEQSGPLRWFDVEMRCASRGCGSSTYCKVEGVPKCLMHGIRQLNEMLCD